MGEFLTVYAVLDEGSQRRLCRVTLGKNMFRAWEMPPSYNSDTGGTKV